jgi:hypothetical protein
MVPSQHAEMSAIASEHGSASTPYLATGQLSHLAGDSLADRHRGVVSRRASLTGGGASAIDDDRPITKRAVSRRASLSGMALPPAKQSPTGSGASALDDDRPMTERAVSRRASLSGMALPPAKQSPTGSGASALDDDRPMTKRAVNRRASLSGTTLPPATQSPQMKKRPSRSRSILRQRSDGKSVSSKQEKSVSQGTKSSEKKCRGRSQSVQRSSKSTEKSKMSERKSPKTSFENRGSGKTSDLPPETRASEKKGRGRSQSAHRTLRSSRNLESNSSGKPTSALPPETQTPDKKARARSKSTQQRTSKTTKEQARRTYDFNKFETDHETKCEVEVAVKTPAESALGRRRERSQSISHRRPSTLPDGSLPANSSIQTEKSSVHSKEISTFETDSDTGGFPTAWEDNKDDWKDSSGARTTSAPADFPAHAAWDDDPWADDDGFFNRKAATVTITKVEMTSTVPDDPNNLFPSEVRGSESTVNHSQGDGSTSSYSRSGSPDLGSAHNRGSGSGSRRGRRSSLTLTEHMKPSFGAQVSDTGSVVSGRSRYSIQGIRRSHSSQGATASTGKRAPPPTVAALFAKKLDDAKKLDQARSASQRPIEIDSGPGADSGLVAENLEAANKLDEIRRDSQRLIMTDSRQDQTKSGSQRPLKGDSGRGIDADSQALCTELCEDAKNLHEIRGISHSPGKADSRLDLGSNKGKSSYAPHPSANSFAARHHDDSMSVSDIASTEPTASVSSTSSRRSSMSSGSSSSRLPRRQSTEMGHHSPRPEHRAKKVNGLRSGGKQLRRGSSLV